jgi:cell division protein FtsN
MSKDYTKKRQFRHKASLPKRLFLYLLVFLCGYGAATVFDVAHVRAWFHHPVTEEDIPKAAAIPETASTKPKPKFEFYTLLSKDNSTAAPTPPKTDAPMQLEVSKAELPPNNPAKLPPAAPPQTTVAVKPNPVTTLPVTPQGQYLVQVASFNKQQDAQRLKASLLLTGFHVTITNIERDRVLWYRVTVGPFPSRVEAEQAQVTVLRDEHMKGIVRKV